MDAAGSHQRRWDLASHMDAAAGRGLYLKPVCRKRISAIGGGALSSHQRLLRRRVSKLRPHSSIEELDNFRSGKVTAGDHGANLHQWFVHDAIVPETDLHQRLLRRQLRAPKR